MGFMRNRLTAPSLHKCLAIALMAPTLAAHAQTNPLARAEPGDPLPLAGRWNGADIELRSNCTNPQNNGQHGTYGEYMVSVDLPTHSITIAQTAVTGLTCNYAGAYQVDGQLQWSGGYACSDGKRGSFRARSFMVTPNALSIRLAIKLDTTESCDVEAILGGSRF